MTNEERDIITRFIERVSGANAGGGFGSVPNAAPPLPPIDREADALIEQLFAKYPEARYRLTQTAFVQEHALAAAQNRMRQLEAALQQAQQGGQQSGQQSGQGSKPGGFLSSLFGGGGQPRPQPPAQNAPPPVWNQGAGAAPPQQYAAPPQQYPPGYQPGMLQRGGSGFLGSALTTAAGVAGGLVAGNALMNLFSPRESLGSGLGAGLGGGALGAGGVSNPWGSETQGGDPGYVDQGSWTTPDQGAAPDQGGYADQGSWDQGSWDQGRLDQGRLDQGGGDQTAFNDPGSWDAGGGGFDSGGSFDDNS